MKKTLALTLLASAAVIAACGGSDGENSNSAGTNGATTGSNANAMAPLDAPCLTPLANGKKMTVSANAGPVTEAVTFEGKHIGQTTFDGKSLDTIDVQASGTLFHAVSSNFRIYLDPETVLFPLGVTEFGHRGYPDGPWVKYRRFTYEDAAGKPARLSLLGMQPNETRTVTMAEERESALATDPQPAFSRGVDRKVQLTVQYIGREDVTAMGKSYANTCKVKIRYDREPGSYFPNLEATVWLAPGLGPVKLSGLPLLRVDTLSAETSGIVAN
ncbi:hypothetical protein SAMN04488595_12169 [Ralstonia sp. 25mfcol4.1]|nr:hypothetical protein SAMN04488595_12169 [Ralstonia sp. 25mfcol4.1]